PTLQGIALLHDDGGVQERRSGEPGQERGVLDRIPEPEAAPAELVVGPPAAERDAEREAAPRGQRPGPHPACPGGVDAPFDQRCHCKRERYREADVAEVQKRRVERETRVLKQRVQPLTIRGRRPDAVERVRREQDEEDETEARSEERR